MMSVASISLWAVHLPDGYINLDLHHPLEGWPWIVGGFIVSGLLAFWGARRIRDEEIPRIALLTAAFTVASGLHVPLGPSSVHLILNGMLGVVLGRRAALAIPIGLFLQAVAGHGGFTTLGINSCVMVVPALFAAALLGCLDRFAPFHRSWFRSLVMATIAVFWVMGAVLGVVLLRAHIDDLDTLKSALDEFRALLPYSVPLSVLAAILAAWLERKLHLGPEFSLGFLLGAGALLLTVALTSLVMYCAGPDNSGARLFALLVFVAHLPLAPVEGVVAGFLLEYLNRAKPEMIRRAANVPIAERNGVASVPRSATLERGAERCPADSAS